MDTEDGKISWALKFTEILFQFGCSPSEAGRYRSENENISGLFLRHIVKLEQKDTSMSADMNSTSI